MVAGALPFRRQAVGPVGFWRLHQGPSCSESFETLLWRTRTVRPNTCVREIRSPLASDYESVRCKLASMEFVGLVVTVIGAAIALAAQRRADMQLINRRFDETQRHIDKRFDDMNKRFNNVNKRFDDTNRRIDALESQQREDSAAFNSQLAAVGRDVAKLAGRVDEVAGMVSAAFQAAFGVVMTRRDRKDREPSAVEQAPFNESGSGEE